MGGLLGMPRFVEDPAASRSAKRKERVTSFDGAIRTNALTMIDDEKARRVIDGGA